VLRCFNCLHFQPEGQQPWAHVVDSCKTLREVRVQGLGNTVTYSSVGDEALEALSKLPYLQILYLPGSAVTDQGLRKLAGARQKLQHVNFSNNSHLQDEESGGLVELVNSCGATMRKLGLEGLDLEGEVMLAIGTCCHKLEELNVAGGVFSDQDLEWVLRRCLDIHSLSLKGSIGIEDPSLLLMASTVCPNLTALDLSGCNQFTAGALLQLVQARPLRALMLAAEMLDEHDESGLYFPEVDAEVISTLAATSANSLRIFSITRPPGLPIEAVLPLVKCCRNLSKLILCDQCFGTVHTRK
jgi:hypothetical protein